MRIVSPTFRIGFGLLLAVLLSVVGYQVLRRSSFYAPDALLQQADGSSWPDFAVQTSPSYIYGARGFNLLPAALRKTPISRPLHIATGSSIPFASHDPIADLRLPPRSGLAPGHFEQATDPFTIPNAAEDCRHTLSRRAGLLTR